MNAKQRKKADKLRTREFTTEHPNKVTYVKYTEILEEVKFSATKDAVLVITSMMAQSLADEYNFGTARINKVISRIRKKLECVENGHVTAKEIFDWCKEKQIKLL